MNKYYYYVELLFTVVVAFIIGFALYVVLLSVFANLDIATEEVRTNLNTFTSAIAGLLVGYKLATLSSKPAKKSRKK